MLPFWISKENSNERFYCKANGDGDRMYCGSKTFTFVSTKIWVSFVEKYGKKPKRMREEKSGNRLWSADLFSTQQFLLLLFSSCVFCVCLVAKHKKLAESNSFFEMQMELECLSTVPVALMGPKCWIYMYRMYSENKTKDEFRTKLWENMHNINIYPTLWHFMNIFDFRIKVKCARKEKRKDVAKRSVVNIEKIK